MDAFIFAPQCVKEVYAKRDAMRAGTSHYSYASSYHDLLSGCKVKKKIHTFQTFRQKNLETWVHRYTGTRVLLDN